VTLGDADAVACPTDGRHEPRSNPVRHRLSYAGVTATLALFIAIGGTTAVGAQALLTGRSVKDESLTGADIQNDTLTGADIRTGSLGSNVFSSRARANLKGATGPAGPAGATGETGPQGPAGVGVTVATATGPDVAGYQDLDPLASITLPRAGDYVVFARLSAHNTGATDDDLNCGLFTGENASGGGGVRVTAGSTATGNVVGAISLTAAQEVVLKCQGGGVTTYDISNVVIRTHDMG
jgi:hypothetical protein